jgi:hypothetical protein
VADVQEQPLVVQHKHSEMLTRAILLQVGVMGQSFNSKF